MPVWPINGILRIMNKKVPALLFILLWLMVSCDLADQFNSPASSATPPEASSSSTAVATVITPPEATPDIAIPTAAVTQTRPSLRVWIPPEIARSTEESAAILNAQFAAFRSSHPDINLIIEQKAVSGQSGILNYLRTGRNIAPSVMPDLIAIPIDQLNIALTEELIYPIDGLVETDTLEDLYPAALNLAIKNSQVSSYPFALIGLPHLVYNSQAVTQAVPMRWEAFAALPYSFVFPANGTPAGQLCLEFYLDAGGTLTNEAGQVALDTAPLTTALQQILTAKSSGFILDQSSNYATLQESWQLFQAGTADFTLTSSEHYLRNRNEDGVYLVTAVPGLQRPLTPLVSGWAWAISSREPAQRELAADLLNSLIESEALGEWSYAGDFLPSRQTSLAFWPEDDAYVAFASEQLNRAEAMPISSANTIITALNNAVFDVVTLAKTPQIAAEEAAASLQP